ncbi:hypothetical protein [Modestobacter sp. URMC 112]
MRRAVLTTLAIGGMIVGAAGPASAAPPERMKNSGTYTSLFSYTEDCRQQGTSRSTCTNIGLNAYAIEDGTVSVCVDTATYVLSRERFSLRSAEYGCTDVAASSLTVTDTFVATLAPTTVVLTSESGRGTTRTVTVSAEDSPVGPVQTSSGRGSFTDGTCTFRYSYTERSAPVPGTITIDGVTFEESGFASTGQNTVTERCK